MNSENKISEINEISVRKAVVSDLSDIEQCANAAYSKYIDRIGKKPAPMVADFAACISKNTVSVALSGKTLAGYIVFFNKDQHLQIENVAVFPSFAGIGIGRVLLEHAEASARNRSLTAIELYTNAVMFENISMYSYLGFEEIERKEEAGFKRVFFRKLLC